MSDSTLKIGDKVYHKSNSSIIWVVEKIEAEEVLCSTLIKETFEQKKQKFELSSVEKYNGLQYRVGGRRTRKYDF